ncbi:MAG: linear amide C-N hydrolase [Bacteroidetes bacterium]|nr:linear amide C-N hydrolase [Bacteroidota bacterium]
MKKLIISISILFASAFINNLLSCTAICVATCESLFLAKNFDWEIDNGYLILNPRGEKKVTFNKSSKKKSWTTKYGSITFNQFGKEFPLGGMNETGLVVEELSALLPVVNDLETHIKINEFQWVQYQLDMCSSVNDVIAHLDQFSMSTLLFPLHYIISDKWGNVAIIELSDIGFKFYTNEDLPFKVLSNNTYAESLKYIKNFQGFGGDMPIVNRKESCERFVKAADMLSKNDRQPNTDEMFLMLDTLKQSDTRWSIVYDITNLKIYFKFHSCVSEKCIDLSRIDFMGLTATKGSDLSECNSISENDLILLAKEDNTKLVEDVIHTMSKELEVADNLKTLKSMVLYGNQFLSE